MKRVTSPLGMPDTWLNSQVGNMMAALIGSPGKLTKDATEEVLLSALRDPKVAARLMSAKDPRTVLETLQPYAANAVAQMSADQK